MKHYYGFDLGDAESAIALLEKENKTPEILKIEDAKSFITAYALLKNGNILVGEKACYDMNALVRKIRFKSQFLNDPEAVKDIRCFATGVLGKLYLDESLHKDEESCFYVGCPAGWNKTERERYREIFEKIEYPPTKIVSESRAALISACQSKYLQVGYDILSKPVLVVDVGSSTTDFAYIMSGKEVQLKTAGEVRLGGGIMDEILLEEAMHASKDEKKIQKVFNESDAWRSYCEFACRKLKEKYFSDEAYWKNNECSQSVSIRYSHFPIKLTVKLNAEIADTLINKKIEKLNGSSFKEVFMQSLQEVHDSITDKEPELIFMTGGVSKMPVIRKWCSEVFPDAVVIASTEPEFSVASGLAYCGKIDEELRAFKEEVQQLIASDKVERIVESHIDDLYHDVVEAMVKPMMEQVALPIIESWREGSIKRLSEIDGVLSKSIDTWLHQDSTRKLLAKPAASWMKMISYELEEYTIPICIKYNVPYAALSLTSYLKLSDFEISLDTKDIFAVEQITWIIDTIVTVLVGLLCGGGGLTLIAEGIPGIAAGAVVSLLVLTLGKDKMQEAMLNMDIAMPIRKMFPMSYFENRVEKMCKEVKAELYASLENDKNEDITERLEKEMSQQIEQCLISMAEVVEIPLH